MAAVMLVFAPLSTFAAVPVPAGCNIPPDLAVWSQDNQTIDRCVKAADVDRANSEAAARSDIGKTSLFFKEGTSVILRTGADELCPLWFSPFGCVIAKILVR